MKKISNSEFEDFNVKLKVIKEYVEKSNNVIDDEMYYNTEKVLMMLKEKINQYYFKTYGMYSFINQYIELTNKLLVKYNKEYNKNIYDVNMFITFYFQDNIKYQQNVINEFYKFGLIEERELYNKYFGNSLKKISQVLSVVYRKDNTSDSKTIYEKSQVNAISEKAKKITDYIIELNKRSMRINQCYLFDTTNTLLEIAVSLPNIIVDNEDDFKNLMEGLYKVFWDNNQKIKEYNLNDELNFVNWLRCFYCHDIEHGSASDVRKKHRRIKQIFKDACGKSIPETAKEWQRVQEYVYDRLISFLENVEIVENVVMSK